MTVTESATTSRLTALREAMQQHAIDAYIVPSEDAHQAWLLWLKEAALWTDGRYFLQASQELDSNWILQKAGLPGVVTKEEWLNKVHLPYLSRTTLNIISQVLEPNSKVGIDPKLVTLPASRTLAESLKRASHTLVSVTENLVDLVWGIERPGFPMNEVKPLPVQFAGKCFEDKLKDVRDEIGKKGTWGFIATGLDEIAWLFNLRGSDVACNPVFFAYALITLETAILYIHESKLTEDAKTSLGSIVEIRPYSQIFDDLAFFGKNPTEKKLWVASTCSLALQDAIGGPNFITEATSPITLFKAIKNATEIQGFRDSHVRDGASLCQFFAWLENELLVNQNLTLTEVDAADKLAWFRSQREHFVGLSFDTISGAGSNAAIMHYSPRKETCRYISPEEIYLCDSGAQYLDGTTDVTRTHHFGTPTSFEKEAYTYVLKGHIQIDQSVFPVGTKGLILDILARTALWRAGLDFRHGTGHGVGHYLNVHEGPHGIGTRFASYNEFPLQSGNTVTNEPGYYHDGHFGIRIENVMIVKEVSTPYNFDGKGSLGFEHVTLVPISTKLVEISLLLPTEREWLNNYHEKVYEKISPLLHNDEMALKWLFKETRPI
ncbi:hypothetical protein HDU79_010463 [Rhizoclosmatium sp. JEL0117]|nr:hypothetical protein HDU79_010463 [Rhizoclosmatium sp. JEL0117]